MMGKETKANPEKYRQQAHDYLKRELNMDDDQVVNIFGVLSVPLKTSLQLVEKAYEDQDLEATAETAHGLKGALLNLGLDELAELAETIEMSSSAGENVTHVKRLAYLQGALHHIIDVKGL